MIPSLQRGAPRRRGPARAIAGALVSSMLACAAPALGQPTADFDFEPNADEPRRLQGDFRSGYLTLEWKIEGEDADIVYEFEVQSAREDAFDTPIPRYDGRGRQVFVSGLGSGDHWFRVRAREAGDTHWGPWSDPVLAPVDHHPMSLAWSLFGVGIVLFACIVGFVAANAGRGAEDG